MISIQISEAETKLYRNLATPMYLGASVPASEMCADSQSPNMCPYSEGEIVQIL